MYYRTFTAGILLIKAAGMRVNGKTYLCAFITCLLVLVRIDM